MARGMPVSQRRCPPAVIVLPPNIRIRASIVYGLVARAASEPSAEICGLLAGEGVVSQVFPASNAASRPATSYEIAPEELLRLMRAIRAAGLEFLGIYHSHPQGPNQPSARDIERAYYPEAAYFIVSPRAGSPAPVRAFSIREGRVAELEIVVE
jgi:proteasome lid subunit RPN8/RPN11